MATRLLSRHTNSAIVCNLRWLGERANLAWKKLRFIAQPKRALAEPAFTHCTNCGTKLHGRYCSACGQESRVLAVSIQAFFRDFIFEQFQFDERIWRTLHLLLFQPGELTHQYLSGKRQRFLPPIRLYFAITIAFFLVLPFSHLHVVYFSTGPGSHRNAAFSTQAPTTGSVPIHQRGTAQPARQSPQTQGQTAGDSLQHWVARAVNPKHFNIHQFRRHFWENAPRVLFFLIPLFALLIKVLYWSRKRYYSEHLIFAVHYHSMTFLNLFLIMLLAWGSAKLPATAGAVLNWGAFGLWLWTLVYLFPAIHRVYQDTWALAIVRGAAILFLYGVALLFGLTAITLMGILLR